MKVAFVLPTLSSGGVEKLVLTLTRGLLERSVEVQIVAANVEGHFIHEVPADAHVVDLRIDRFSGNAKMVLGTFRLAQHLASADAPSIVVAAPGYAGPVTVWARALANKTVIQFSLIDTPLNARGRLRWHQKALPMLLRQLDKHVDGYIVPYERVAEYMRQRIRSQSDKVHIIPHPIDVKRTVRESHVVTNETRERSREPTIVTVGRLSPVKGIHTIIEALSLLRARKPVRLRVVGDGPERLRLEALAKYLGVHDLVSFEGYTANPYPLIAEASAFVLASSTEAFGLVLLEALALGTPVIATKVPSGGPQSILDSGSFGTLVEPGDPEALAVAIELVTRQKHDKERLRKRAELFDLPKISDKYAEVFSRAFTEKMATEYVP